MYYKKLVNIYEHTKCSESFPISLVSLLEDYILWSLKRDRRNLNPFQFGNLAGIATDEALEFFMYFSKEPGIFELEYYYECSTHSCSERIYLTTEELDDPNSIFLCDECQESYNISEIEEYIKVSFRLKKSFVEEPLTVSNGIRSNPNNIFRALQGIPKDLKPDSPSSSDDILSNSDEGESRNDIDISIVKKVNKEKHIFSEEENSFLARVGGTRYRI